MPHVMQVQLPQVAMPQRGGFKPYNGVFGVLINFFCWYVDEIYAGIGCKSIRFSGYDWQ